MKKIYFGILCCLLGFTTSCSDDDNATALLQIDPSTDLVFEAVGGTRTIEVKTDQATWQVESNQTWCKVEKSDGTHFTVTAEENTASEPMPQAAVTVTAGTAQVVLKVDQKGTATPPLAGTTFEITLGEPTPTGVNMKVVPSDNDAVYYYDVLSKQILDQHHSGDFCDSHPGFCGCDFPGGFCFRFFYGSEKSPVADIRFEGFDLPVQVRNGGLFGAEEITGPQHVVDGRDEIFVAVAAGQIT